MGLDVGPALGSTLGAELIAFSSAPVLVLGWPVPVPVLSEEITGIFSPHLELAYWPVAQNLLELKLIEVNQIESATFDDLGWARVAVAVARAAAAAAVAAARAAAAAAAAAAAQARARVVTVEARAAAAAAARLAAAWAWAARDAVHVALVLGRTDAGHCAERDGCNQPPGNGFGTLGSKFWNCQEVPA